MLHSWLQRPFFGVDWGISQSYSCVFTIIGFVDYLDAEMNCGWCVFFVDRQQMKWAITILVFSNLLMPPILTEPCNFEPQSFSSIVSYSDCGMRALILCGLFSQKLQSFSSNVSYRDIIDGSRRLLCLLQLGKQEYLCSSQLNLFWNKAEYYLWWLLL